MNRAERRFRSETVYLNRKKLFVHFWGEYANTAHVLKSTGRPCSCHICKRERYSRKEKHRMRM